jgi:hypothetical protein
MGVLRCRRVRRVPLGPWAPPELTSGRDGRADNQSHRSQRGDQDRGVDGEKDVTGKALCRGR